MFSVLRENKYYFSVNNEIAMLFEKSRKVREFYKNLEPIFYLEYLLDRKFIFLTSQSVRPVLFDQAVLIIMVHLQFSMGQGIYKR